MADEKRFAQVKAHRVEAILNEIGVDRPVNVKGAIAAWKAAAELGDAWSARRLRELALRPEYAEHLKAIPKALTEERLTALVVEDDDVIRLELVRAIGELGLVVHSAPDGDEAIAFLREGDYACVILDIKLPKRDGFSILRYLEIHNLLKRMPIIACTGYANSENITKLKQFNVKAIVAKPFAIEQITDIIMQILPGEVKTDGK